MDTDDIRRRRRYSRDLKLQVIAECDVPGASVAKVAMRHGINANIVHGWRKLLRRGQASPVAVSPSFVPVTVEPTLPECGDERAIQIQVQRGALTVKLTWPLGATADLAVWTRELLR